MIPAAGQCRIFCKGVSWRFPFLVLAYDLPVGVSEGGFVNDCNQCDDEKRLHCVSLCVVLYAPIVVYRHRRASHYTTIRPDFRDFMESFSLANTVPNTPQQTPCQKK